MKKDGTLEDFDRSKIVAGAAKPGRTACYGYLARGAKWKTVEPWIANLANTRSLDQTALFNLVAAGVGKWEGAASSPNPPPKNLSAENPFRLSLKFAKKFIPIKPYQKGQAFSDQSSFSDFLNYSRCRVSNFGIVS